MFVKFVKNIIFHAKMEEHFENFIEYLTVIQNEEILKKHLFDEVKNNK